MKKIALLSFIVCFALLFAVAPDSTRVEKQLPPDYLVKSDTASVIVVKCVDNEAGLIVGDLYSSDGRLLAVDRDFPLVDYPLTAQDSLILFPPAAPPDSL